LGSLLEKKIKEQMKNMVMCVCFMNLFKGPILLENWLFVKTHRGKFIHEIFIVFVFNFNAKRAS